MARLNLIDAADAQPAAANLLDAAQKQLGMVPNFLKALANSPSALSAFMGMNGPAHQGTLPGKITERIALAVGEQNSCQYCVSAHTALAKKHGLDDAEIEAARRGEASEAKAAAAVAFATAVVENRGSVSNGELQAVRDAGFDDGEIVEILVHVGLNTLTNYLGKVGQIDIDFPEVELLGTAASA